MRNLPPLERFVRRSRVYRGRVGRMMTRSQLKHPCAFMHLPKCGGTSLSEGLYALVPLNLKIGILDSPSIRRTMGIVHADVDDPRPFHDEGDEVATVSAFREALLIMHMAHQAHLIHGHFLFSQRAHRHFGDRYKYVTVMRHPVARTLSNYGMALRTKDFVGDFNAFLESAKGRRMALHNLRYFSGRPDVAPDGEAEALREAKATMDLFSVIGFIEKQPAFLDSFADVFGARPAIGHYNKAESQRVEITADQKRRLEILCGPDIELHDAALRRG